MYKKMAYMATAVLLGFVVMLAPLQMLPTMISTGEMNMLRPHGGQVPAEAFNGGRVALFQLNLLNMGAILAFSFVLALGIFLYAKRQPF